MYRIEFKYDPEGWAPTCKVKDAMLGSYACNKCPFNAHWEEKSVDCNIGQEVFDKMTESDKELCSVERILKKED